MVEFSIVCPIHNEVNLIPITLPSFYSVNPSELVLCLDKPAPKNVVKTINKIASWFHAKELTRIVEVERNPDFAFHQAWVRRKGFLEAKYDRILTTDIDLCINKNVLKAIKLVGKNSVGLASLSKLHYPHNLTDYWRVGVIIFLRDIIHGILDSIIATTTFSGLYSLWRPYWLDSESGEEVERLVNPKQFYRGESPKHVKTSPISGEDTFLRDSMVKKYSCVYLKDIGAVDLGFSLESRPEIQYAIGQYFAKQGRSIIVSFGRTFLRAQPYYLKGFLSEKAKKLHKEGKDQNRRKNSLKLINKIKFHIDEIIWSQSLMFTLHRLLAITNRRFGGQIFPVGSEEFLKPYMFPLNKGCFVDVGANFGVWTNFVAEKGFEVHAFEPSPRPYKHLTKNASFNVHTYNTALGDKEAVAELNLHETSGHNGLVKRAKDFSGRTIKIQIKTLDSFQLENIGLIKIDTEGYEVPILLGAKETILKWKPRLIIEVHSPYKEQSTIITNILKSMEYVVIKKHKIGSYQPMLIGEP